MKFRKTKASKRGTYCYVFGERSIELVPGKDGVTEEMVRMLHLEDDREVRNNNKHSKVPYEKWEKKIVDEWQEKHPDEEVPKKYHLSLEFYSNGEDDSNDKNSTEYEIFCSKEDIEAMPVSNLQDLIAELDERKQIIYKRVLVDEEKGKDVAADLHITTARLSQIVKSIETYIRKNEARIFKPVS